MRSDHTAPFIRPVQRRIVYGLALVVFSLLILHSLGAPLDHDEHQFVASGAVLLRQGLLPYRDYAYFHTPYLIFIYAMLFSVTDKLLLVSRLFCAVSGFAIAVTLFIAVRNLFDEQPLRPNGAGVLAGGLAVLLLIVSPVFIVTSGRAWNHDFPTLLAFGAFLLASNWRRRGSMLCFAAAGVLIGVAIGSRLTFAPSALALSIIVWRNGGPRRFKSLAAYTFALALSLFPCTWLALKAPQQFFFGNLLYPIYNTAFRQTTGMQWAASWPGKLEYLGVDILLQPAHLALLMLFIAAIFLRFRAVAPDVYPGPECAQINLDPYDRRRNASMNAAIMSLGVLAGSLAPTPWFAMYFFNPLPFFIFWAASLIREVYDESPRSRSLRRLAVGAAILASINLFGYISPISRVIQSQSPPLALHWLGRRFARSIPRGATVLTLEPIIPLEGGVQIYPVFVTGPFAMRVGPLVPKNNEESFHLVDPNQLVPDFSKIPNRAIIIGTEGPLESPIKRMAAEGDYDLRAAIDGYELWTMTNPQAGTTHSN